MEMPERWASYFARLSPAVTFLYFFIVIVSVLHLFFESRRLKSTLRRTLPPSLQLQTCFERLCRELHVGRCELRLAPDLRSPATCYWWRSNILLPLELVPHLNNHQLEDVLRHELFHVRQHDYLWDRLAALGCRLVFFHPLAWLAYRHLRWERELACDYEVVRECSEARLRYAECLTDLARWFVARRMSSPGISFLFFRIPAQSQSSGRSQRTVDPHCLSKSCPWGTCLRSHNSCFFVAAGSGPIFAYTDSPDQLLGWIWECFLVLIEKEGGGGQGCSCFYVQGLKHGGGANDSSVWG